MVRINLALEAHQRSYMASYDLLICVLSSCIAVQAWEQANFGDSVMSAVMGRPLFSAAWAFQGEINQFRKVGQDHLAWSRLHLDLVQDMQQSWKGDLTSDLRAVSR